MPIIDFTNPFYSFITIILFVLCIYLAKNQKTNTVPCIMLLAFLTILVGHTIELANIKDLANITILSKNIVIDEAFTFASYLAFLWLDRIQIDASKKKKGNKKDQTIEDGLDFLWKKV